MVAEYRAEEVKKAHEVLYSEGIKMRYKVAGKQYVDKSLANADNPFSRAMQDYVSESCWGSIWTRPGLDLKIRSFLNIAMLCCQNRGTELATHVKGALNNGATEEEIREVILQAACYCGMPAGIEGFRVAWKAIEEHKANAVTEGNQVTDHADVGIASRSKGDE
ncbi:4-carboxymuconolactone decarboxylase [Fulvia fulva]|uniref:4-carboxymuconolactone decarboxylase n=1 Tax=Passalora fulva TaxID=5499 RepID=A0A9Q8L9B5_PASFU|nr:4-carboxymuconolactone decarboxylase [Fulvia fulva]KAK4631307.1 4-carboxymuconolactone decarboxylase [Fulvia fulva]KAK4633165.1 4-carboxymuconolactone decarboxylase [Fulvia fulva]UJO13189.1 4-carboxymuconolactone decarboxylase [Fulvia fulva]WPV10677.1 4-carboxymuconolactone decarboxylase [Fulvia fulva]WPV25637.1 4-carboxymuconolactone decarboxylase [Fulvia fulva]